MGFGRSQFYSLNVGSEMTTLIPNFGESIG